MEGVELNQAELERRARFEDMRCRGTGSVIKHKIFCQGCIDCDWVARKAYDDPEWAAAIGVELKRKYQVRVKYSAIRTFEVEADDEKKAEVSGECMAFQHWLHKEAQFHRGVKGKLRVLSVTEIAEKKEEESV